MKNIHICQITLDNTAILYTWEKKNIKNILYHLASLEAELITDPDSRRFTGYQVAFDQIADAATAEARHALIGGLTEEHPFYAWLVKSTFA